MLVLVLDLCSVFFMKAVRKVTVLCFRREVVEVTLVSPEWKQSA